MKLYIDFAWWNKSFHEFGLCICKDASPSELCLIIALWFCSIEIGIKRKEKIITVIVDDPVKYDEPNLNGDVFKKEIADSNYL
jgi:hypothetical protein